MSGVRIKRIANNTSGTISYKNTQTNTEAIVKAKELPDDFDTSDDLNDEIPTYRSTSGPHIEIKFNNLSPSKLSINNGKFYDLHMAIDIENPEEVADVGKEATGSEYVIFVNETEGKNIELDIVEYDAPSWTGGAPAANALAGMYKFIAVVISKRIG